MLLLGKLSVAVLGKIKLIVALNVDGLNNNNATFCFRLILQNSSYVGYVISFKLLESYGVYDLPVCIILK